jgi:hypothetical protein
VPIRPPHLLSTQRSHQLPCTPPGDPTTGTGFLSERCCMTGRRPAPPFRENSDDVGTRIGAATILGFMAHSALAQAVAEQDQEFAQKAAEGGLIEVQLGELAQQQAKDEQVVQFGERMVQDHGRAQEKPMAIAEQRQSSCRRSFREMPSRNTRRCSSSQAPSSTRPTWTRWLRITKRTSSCLSSRSSPERTGSARLCGGDPPNAPRAHGTRKAGSVADYGSGRRWRGAEARRQIGQSRPCGVTLRATTRAPQSTGRDGRSGLAVPTTGASRCHSSAEAPRP